MHHDFTYVAPQKKDDFLRILKEKGKNAKILAGGTDLIVDLRGGRFKPEVVIDIKHVAEYQKISFSEKEGLSIGAAVTCIELMENKTVLQKYPLLAEAASRIGSPQLRNRATIAGNLCTASPCADMGCSLLSLGASVELASAGGARKIFLKDFFAGVKKTALKEYEVVQRIIVPAEMANAKSGMEKLKRIKGHDLAVASVALIKKGNVLRVGIGSCAPTPIVLKDFSVKASVKEVVAEALKTIKPIDDIRASKEYRTFMVQVMIERIMDRVK